MAAAGLTKAGIVQAALDVPDEGGIDGLTVRALAKHLHVQAPALYWHVHSKQDLLDEMATEIWRQLIAALVALPETLSWQELMTAFAGVLRRTLLAHRDGAKVFSGTYLTDAGVLESQEGLMARMLGEGFTLPDVIRAYSLLYNFTVGFCIEEQAVAQAQVAGDDRYSLVRRAERLDSQVYPLVLQAGPELFADPNARFSDLITVIIETIERMRCQGA